MHRYNNQDHSMLTTRYAAEAILADWPNGRDGPASKRTIWEVNIDDDYHEQVAR